MLETRSARQVTTEARNRAKRLAYGLLYGMGPAALAKDLNCDRKSAADLSAAFLASLPGVVRGSDNVCKGCCAASFCVCHAPATPAFWHQIAGRQPFLFHL